MFRFRSIKPEYLDLYEKVTPESNFYLLDQYSGVTKAMLDRAECIGELDSTDESDKIYKVFNYDLETSKDQNADIDMKDEVTTNASPDQLTAAQK